MNNELKMVIVVRKDLNMRTGKIVAQTGHAVLGAVLRNMDCYTNSEKIRNWYLGNQKKICVYVNSEKELLDIKENCIKKDINHYLVQDLGLTEFNNISTYTCIAIGPDYNFVINEITEDLPLL